MENIRFAFLSTLGGKGVRANIRCLF